MAHNHKGSPCYFCGGRSTTSEHIPPRMLFKYVDCDRITVPSSHAHNSEKSGVDQAILSSYAVSIASARRGVPLSPLASQVIAKLLAGVPYVKKHVSKRAIPIAQGIVRIPVVTAFLESSNTQDWINQLTAGWIWNALETRDPSIDWNQVNAWTPDHMPINPSDPDVDRVELSLHFRDRGRKLDLLESLGWHRGWSSHPKPYPSDFYHFHVASEYNSLAFRHKFFGVFTYYVLLTDVDPTTVEKVRKKAGLA